MSLRPCRCACARRPDDVCNTPWCARRPDDVCNTPWCARRPDDVCNTPWCAGYIGDILDEAKRYAEHRSREGDDVKISKEDVRLAVQAKVSVCTNIPECCAHVWSSTTHARAHTHTHTRTHHHQSPPPPPPPPPPITTTTTTVHTHTHDFPPFPATLAPSWKCRARDHPLESSCWRSHARRTPSHFRLRVTTSTVRAALGSLACLAREPHTHTHTHTHTLTHSRTHTHTHIHTHTHTYTHTHAHTHTHTYSHSCARPHDAQVFAFLQTASA
jgi:hypothetical protein